MMPGGRYVTHTAAILGVAGVIAILLAGCSRQRPGTILRGIRPGKTTTDSLP